MKPISIRAARPPSRQGECKQLKIKELLQFYDRLPLRDTRPAPIGVRADG
jgi:hypothetical protein